ncbi:hypothetical protein ACIBFB_06240 [Nocardiopsis sp. NPDC050513]|uniref:hypothetical protein n=1 Tax=Nocardiopsis sp. NPDC050513 TaxID=3364338 RepID=UPI0037B63889
MDHDTTGRHRRRHRTLAGQLWALAAAALATALAFVFVPDPPMREPAAITPPPEPPRPQTPDTSTSSAQELAGPENDDPDETGGALVRPYMRPRPPGRPLVPRPRPPEGDLLAAPTDRAPDDLGDLAAAIRTYLNTVG